VEERSIAMPPEGPLPTLGAPGAGGQAGSTLAADPRVLTILSTEHWSLLSARSLVYNEAFSRAGMYLTFLSATMVALGLIAAATGFTDVFLLITAFLLAIDLFIGYASLGRIASASSEDIRFLQGMNRIRHAYVEIAPEVAPYFVSGHNDDPETVLSLYGPVESSRANAIIHGLTTTPGMIGTINAAVGGALAAVLTMLAIHDPRAAGIVGVLAFLVLFVTLILLTRRKIEAFWSGLPVLFPRDGSPR
jgi:hypothetical protein